MSDFYRQAKKAMPKGYYILPNSEPIRGTDLVWNWCNNEWLQADSELWKFNIFIVPRDEIICVIRKAEFENFGVTRTRNYSIKREDQARLF
jgi:hypothetical protein